MEITNFDEFQYFVNYTNSNGRYLDSANNNRIDSSPFQNCINLKSIVLPPTFLISLSVFAILNSKILIPKSVGLCDVATFKNCVNLTSIVFEDGGDVPLYVGGDLWLENTQVTILVLPFKTYRIRGYWRRGSNLNTLYVKSTIPPILEHGWEIILIPVIYTFLLDARKFMLLRPIGEVLELLQSMTLILTPIMYTNNQSRKLVSHNPRSQ